MIISVHVPKTAGRSFLALLQATFGGDRVREDWSGGPKIEGGVSRWGAFAQRIADQRSRLHNYRRRHAFECIHGHFLASKYQFMGAPIVAWVRDPVERVASHYAYFERNLDPRNLHSVAIRKDMTLLEFAAHPGVRNIQSRYLDVPLERLTFVGRTECFDEDVCRAGEILQIPVHGSHRFNVNPDPKGERYDISEEDRARILELNQEDVRLLDRVREAFHR